MQPKVLSKFYRLKFSDAIRSFIESIPVKKLIETQEGNHVYLAHGRIEWASSHVRVRVRIWTRKGSLFVSVKSPKKIAVTATFNTDKERKEAVRAVQKALDQSWN